MKLNAENVTRIFEKCLAEKNLTTEKVCVKGILTIVEFDQEKLENHKSEIMDMVFSLPDCFKKNKGGGMSFLGMCDDKEGHLWTGDHAVMEQLLLLGLAVKAMTYCLPRSMWSILPAGMPYVMVED